MQNKLSPYAPISQELESSGQLISIKQAAACNDCCEATLKSNAKSRRLLAYQAHFGAPVMVLPSDVEKFLISRRDIASKHHLKKSPAVFAAGLSLQSAQSTAYDELPVCEVESLVSIGDMGISIKLHALKHAQTAEIALVGTALIEIGQNLLHHVSTKSNQTNN